MRWSQAVLGSLGCVAPALGIALVLFLMDNLLGLPSALRFPLSSALVFFLGLGLVRRVILPLMKTLRPEQAALLMEQRLGRRDNLIINSFLFEKADLCEEERRFADRAISHSRETLDKEKIPPFWEQRRVTRFSVAFGLLLVAWTLYFLFAPRHAANAWVRFALPLGDVPPASNLILEISPADGVTVTEGDKLEVTVNIRSSDDRLAPPALTPVIVWREGAASLPSSLSAGEKAPMLLVPKSGRQHRFVFNQIRRPLVFRVWAGETCSPCVAVKVRRLPRILETSVRIAPPAYTGLKESVQPGPPAPLTVLVGSMVKTDVKLSEPVRSLILKAGGRERFFERVGPRWHIEFPVSQNQPYELLVSDPALQRPAVVAQGEITVKPDVPPEVDFVADDRNRFVNPGEKLEIEIQAGDDFGLASLAVKCTRSDDPQSAKEIKSWSYMGPPGNPRPVRERWPFEVDPAIFQPGAAYILEAVARDFHSPVQQGVSKPLILRVRSLQDLSLPPGDPLEELFNLLKKTIASQAKANSQTENFHLYLADAVKSKSTRKHQKALTERQGAAKKDGDAALGACGRQPVAKKYEPTLKAIVAGEMPAALEQIARFNPDDEKRLDHDLSRLEERQAYILNDLISLLGHIAEDRQAALKEKQEAGKKNNPVVSPREALEKLEDLLKDFTQDQKQVVQISKSILEHGPEDLTSREDQLLTEMARLESKHAAIFQEALTDFSKLPLQDFADGKVIQELNCVYQEIQMAADALYKKNITLAVPREQSGLELAKEMIHNIERWLPNTPDKIKWVMEEPAAPSDVPLADMAGELEDIVGELLDKEENMTEDVEDVTSTWMDSADKGIGWDAVDGPISNMSARGVTGNQLPNQSEIGGRSGEGRTGRSHGQMVGDTMVGKGGRETPTRLTPSPFEQGSVKDQSKDQGGGATGGGKMAGVGEEGLRGPTPPSLQQQMVRLAAQQAKLRQEAETLALRLRKQRIPSGDIEAAVASMKRLEQSASVGDGLAIRRSFQQTLDALGSARSSVRAERVSNREKNYLPENYKSEILNGLQDRIPKNYESMIGPYFRSLGEMKN